MDCCRLFFVFVHDYIAYFSICRFALQAHLCVLELRSRDRFLVVQKRAAVEEPGSMEDDATDNEEVGGDEGAAQIPAPKRPRKLTHRSKQGCFCCGVTRAKKFYHCSGVLPAGALVGAGPDDVLCMGCYDDRRKNRFPTMPHDVRRH
jgi:hypothetical protein